MKIKQTPFYPNFEGLLEKQPLRVNKTAVLRKKLLQKTSKK